jgi:hypothetical protein
MGLLLNGSSDRHSCKEVNHGSVFLWRLPVGWWRASWLLECGYGGAPPAPIPYPTTAVQHYSQPAEDANLDSADIMRPTKARWPRREELRHTFVSEVAKGDSVG